MCRRCRCRCRCRGGGGFDPTTVGTLLFWYDVTAGAVVSGAEVSQLTDLSGNNNHLTNDAGLRSLYEANWRNGNAAIVGAANRALFRNTITQGDTAQPITLYLAGQWRQAAGAVAQTSFVNARPGGGQNGHIIRTAGAGGAFVGFSAGTALTAPGLTQTNMADRPLLARTLANGAASRFDVVANALGAPGSSGNAGANGVSGLVLMAETAIGGGAFLNGRLAYLLGYAGNIPSVNPAGDAAIWSYMGARFQVTP